MIEPPEQVSAHEETTGHTVVYRRCPSPSHTHRDGSWWCVECGDYVTSQPAPADTTWDDPNQYKWGE